MQLFLIRENKREGDYLGKSKISDVFKMLSKKQDMCEMCHERKATRSKMGFAGDREVRLCSRCYDMIKF